MLTLLPTPAGYLPWYDDIGLQNWFDYRVSLMLDTQYDSTGSTQENGFALGANIVYNSISFAGLLLPIPEGSYIIPGTTIPTRRKKMNVTGYNTGVARTAQSIKCNFLLNKKFDAGTSQWWTGFQVTIPLETAVTGAGSGISAFTHACLLKKVTTGGAVSTLKTLSVVSTNVIGSITYYTWSDNTAIGSIAAGDVLYIEYIASYTAGGHTNTGSTSNLSIITNGGDSLFATIP